MHVIDMLRCLVALLKQTVAASLPASLQLYNHISPGNHEEMTHNTQQSRFL